MRQLLAYPPRLQDEQLTQQVGLCVRHLVRVGELDAQRVEGNTLTGRITRTRSLWSSPAGHSDAKLRERDLYLSHFTN